MKIQTWLKCQKFFLFSYSFHFRGKLISATNSKKKHYRNFFFYNCCYRRKDQTQVYAVTHTKNFTKNVYLHRLTIQCIVLSLHLNLFLSLNIHWHVEHLNNLLKENCFSLTK